MSAESRHAQRRPLIHPARRNRRQATWRQPASSGPLRLGRGPPEAAHDLDFFLVVDAVENCVTHATRDCRDVFPSVQFFVLSAAEYRRPAGLLSFPARLRPNRWRRSDACLHPTREDAMDSITHGYTDTLRTLRQQLKRREWAIGDDWARQVWWNLKSFKYATLDVCWLLRRERPTDTGRAALILEAEGLASAARALTEWPDLETLAAAAEARPDFLGAALGAAHRRRLCRSPALSLRGK